MSVANVKVEHRNAANFQIQACIFGVPVERTQEVIQGGTVMQYFEAEGDENKIRDMAYTAGAEVVSVIPFRKMRRGEGPRG